MKHECGDTKPNGPEAFFCLVNDKFLKAVKARGIVDRHYCIGGYHVILRFAGSALLNSMTQAMDHLTADATPPDLSISLWDSESTGVSPPQTLWSMEDILCRGDIKGLNDCRFRTNAQMNDCILSALDIDSNHAISWAGNAAVIPYYERSAPLKIILHWWMERHHRQIIHAAAVGNTKQAVLIVGKSGSGKSNTSLTCLSAGMSYLGDDYVLVDKESPPNVYSLYSTGRFYSEDLPRFSFVSKAIGSVSSSEKSIAYLYKDFRAQIKKKLPIYAILVARLVQRAETRLYKTSSAVAMSALAPSSIFQLGGGQSAFQTVAGLAGKLPCYILEIGTDPTFIPDAILGLLNGRSS